jgi:hypothetical protein
MRRGHVTFAAVAVAVAATATAFTIITLLAVSPLREALVQCRPLTLSSRDVPVSQGAPWVNEVSDAHMQAVLDSCPGCRSVAEVLAQLNAHLGDKTGSLFRVFRMEATPPRFVVYRAGKSCGKQLAVVTPTAAAAPTRAWRVLVEGSVPAQDTVWRL